MKNSKVVIVQLLTFHWQIQKLKLEIMNEVVLNEDGLE